MAFDPRCVAFEGRLHADRRTAEYVGRASHEADAACFRSRRAVAASASSQRLRVFYYETQIMATNCDPTSELAANSLPPRINNTNSSVTIRRHAAQDQDAAATTAREWRRRAELHAMDLEDVQIPARNGDSGEVPVNFNFSLNPRIMQQMRSRIDRRRLRRSSERKKFNHKVAVGFILDDPEQKLADSGGISRSFTGFSRPSGFIQARRTVKEVMQRVLPDVTADGDSESSSEDEEGRKINRKTFPAILHRDLGESANSLAYVGKTGCVISHGREFLQCERYGAGDVVGCGVLFDTNTFFFTLNGKLMGMLSARDVYDLDDFGEFESSEEDSDDDNAESEEDGNGDTMADRDVRIRVDTFDDVVMEDTDGRHEEEKALYPSVSLHGVGECVQAVFDPKEFQFDLTGFEQQIQKERQHALLAERDKQSQCKLPIDIEQSNRMDETAMNELVQDFFLHYGYENAFKTFESALAPSKRQRVASDDTNLDYSDEAEASSVLGATGVEDMEDDSKDEGMDCGDPQRNLCPPIQQQMRESLSLRHEIREHIRCFRTAQALVVLEQNMPTLLNNGTSCHSRSLQKLMLYCRILCVVDVLTREGGTKARPSLATNGLSKELHSSLSTNVHGNGWNPELAIEFAQQVFGSSEIKSKGKRTLQDCIGVQNKREGTSDVALAMSLLLYDRRENIPSENRAQKFLTHEFRESVSDKVNRLILADGDLAKTEKQVSALETFMDDLESFQKECLRQGCCVYPESVETTSNGKSKSTSRRRRASVSSSSDDSSSQSEQDDRLDDDDDE
ncbi:hypothetical protein PHPALM_28424 [Phytophthora palmivora]|uniref:SPRY domain-containing protein n=1 Tax=Phytophthora palmivora TaxID=4796 RepID=A0A2P4XA58_9STRA|nr:hypothetical protein PHPALM_28424 [Phytophthora palmivora]